ncbi:MAG TPA: hypothetical protein DCE71_08135 [Parachlamydiales bacterium]|nr:hypothetical protein [Parachlamydiales bacterium]
MSNKYLEVSNYGPGASNRYAHNVQEYDPRIIDDARFIPEKTTISSAKPYLPTEFDHLFSPYRRSSISAGFVPPANYDTGLLFSGSLIPSLGSAETQEEIADKVDNFSQDFQKTAHSPEEEKSLSIIRSLMTSIIKGNRNVELANDRRIQFQRG